MCIRDRSYTYGTDVVADFLAKFDFDLVVRAHQVVENGYEFFGKRQLVTVFSAPNYCGEFDNAGGMLVVGADLRCSFKILRPVNPPPADDAPTDSDLSDDDDAPDVDEDALARLATPARAAAAAELERRKAAFANRDSPSSAGRTPPTFEVAHGGDEPPEPGGAIVLDATADGAAGAAA